MRRLTSPLGAIPRAFRNHRTPEGHAYRVYLTAILARLGPLSPSAHPTLREVGRLAVELEAIGRELEAVKSAGRRRDAGRLRRQMIPMRTQLITLERRLEELTVRRSGKVDPFADVSRAVREARRA